MPLTRSRVCDCGTTKTETGEYLACPHCDRGCRRNPNLCAECRTYMLTSGKRISR